MSLDAGGREQAASDDAQECRGDGARQFTATGEHAADALRREVTAQQARGRGPRPVVDGGPRTETRATAANIVGVLWATAKEGATVKELLGAIGMTRERLEAAYDYLLEHPPLGLQVQRQGDEFFLVTAPEVGAAVERHLGNPRPVALSPAALEVLAIVTYKQPIARAGIERIRGTNRALE